MKETHRNPKVSLLILTVVLFGIFSVLIGCGDNSRPSIEAITDDTVTDRSLTLAVNSRKTVEFFIADADDDDTHTVSASSENTTVAAVSVDHITADFTITGVGVGSTTVTVTATDDSGQDNSSAELVFEVTVVEPHVIASTSSPLTELSIKEENVVTLTLVGLIYKRGSLRHGITVNGFHDVGTSEYRLDRVSDTVAEVTFDGNFDTHDAMLTFVVTASALAEYDGPPLTAQIPVTNAIDIQGPWLWIAAPTDPNAGGGVSTEIGSLVEASNGGVTETDVAQNGVNEGDIIGQFQWTSGLINNTHEACKQFCSVSFFGIGKGCATLCWLNNINDVFNALGFGTGGNIKSHTAYALINVVSPSNQNNAVMGVKSDDAIKVWLNGEVIHREAATVLGCRSIHVSGAFDPTVCTPDSDSPTEYSIPVKLKAGDNLLLVKVRQHGDYWGMAVRMIADFATAIPKR